MLPNNTNKAWIGLTVVLLLLFFTGWFIYNTDLQHEVENASKETKNELRLMSNLIKERLQKRNYQLANSFVLNWGKNKPEIAEITLTAKNGFKLAHYKRTQISTHELVETTDIPYSYDSLATLKLNRSIDHVYLSQKYFMYQFLIGYMLIAAILYFLVHTNLRTQKQKQELIYENKRRKQTEKSLKEREQNLKVTLNSIADAVIATNVEGNITRMNAVAEQLTGWSFKEAQGQPLKSIFTIINASTRKPVTHPVDKVLTNGEIVSLSNHTTLISKDGTEYQIADSAAPIRDDEHILGMVLVFNDVTEQYQLRQAASKSERDLQAIMDHSPAIISVKDTYGCFTFVNQQFEKLFNKKRKDIIGKTLYDIYSKDLADEMQGNDKAVLEAGHALESEEVRSLDDGLHTYVSIKFPIFDDTDNIYGVCSISTDITERRRQEEQLRRSQKMDALGKLTGGIAHDYNNLLGIIQGYAEQLNGHLSHEPKLAKYAMDIHHAAERGAKLTKKLLAFSQQKAPDATILDINNLLHEQHLMLEKTLTARIKLVLDLAEDLWPVELDSGDLEDAIVNMSINAQHAMKSGGQLTIRTINEQIREMDAKLLHMQTGDYVKLSITDTGCGMDEATKERIFDPFYTTKGDRGTGLGLSQVYGFVERSGGAIKAYSDPGHGSCFILYFPRNHKTVTKMKTPTIDTVHSLQGNETLLVVDDERAMVELAHDILVTQGYRVLTADDGEQALAVLEKETVELIISDVIMPNVDGYQLAAIVKQRYPDIKLQIVSGFADDRHNNIADDELYKNMLYKPYASKTLLVRVRSLLDEANTKDSLTSRTIMVVDDEEDMRELFKLNLEKLGCKTIPASNGDEAIALFRQSSKSGESIDAIIMDLSFPDGQSGQDIAKDIRAIDPNARMIVASGHTEGQEMTHYQDYGFNGAIEKNFNREKIKRVLTQVLSID